MYTQTHWRCRTTRGALWAVFGLRSHALVKHRFSVFALRSLEVAHMSWSAGGPIFCQSDLNLNLRKLQRLKTSLSRHVQARLAVADLSPSPSLSACSCFLCFPPFFPLSLFVFLLLLRLTHSVFSFNPSLLFCLVWSVFFFLWSSPSPSLIREIVQTHWSRWPIAIQKGQVHFCYLRLK